MRNALEEGESGLPQAVCSITGGGATARERNRRLRRAYASSALEEGQHQRPANNVLIYNVDTQTVINNLP